MAKICVRCNKKLSFFGKPVSCTICKQMGCEKCLTFGFNVNESLWKKMIQTIGGKTGHFNVEGDLIERSVCSEKCALALVDLYLRVYENLKIVDLNITNSTDISIIQNDGSDELYIHLNYYLTKEYMKQYSKYDLRTKGMVHVKETGALHDKILKKFHDKNVQVEEDFVSL